MRFVDSDPSKFFLFVDNAKKLPEVIQLAEFWSHVKQASVWVTAAKVLKDGNFECLRRSAVDCGHVDTCCAQRSYLIVHESKEWRDHDCDSIIDDCRQLEAQALAETRSGL